MSESRALTRRHEMRFVVPQVRQREEAFAVYLRLVGILDDQEWTRDMKRLEVELGRTIQVRDRQAAYGAAREAFDDAIVDVIATALEAGISQAALVESRGWLSHNDMRGYFARARRPIGYGFEGMWPQHAALRAARADVSVLAETDIKGSNEPGSRGSCLPQKVGGADSTGANGGAASRSRSKSSR